KSGAWSRSSDFDEVTTGEVEQGASVFVENGSNFGNTSWALKTGGTIVLGTTDLEFLQTAGSASYTAGTGLNLNGTTFSVDNSIAKKSEINSQDLQSVTDKGSTTTNNITLQKFVGN